MPKLAITEQEVPIERRLEIITKEVEMIGNMPNSALGERTYKALWLITNELAILIERIVRLELE